MIRPKIIILALAAILSMANTVWAQTPLIRDEKAEQLVSLGKKYVATQNWDDAANTFILASQRPENQLTTTVLYYLGLSWYHKNEFENAKRRFDQIIRDYPQSKYVEEAQFHSGIINLKSAHVNDKERGLDLMLKLANEAKTENLKIDALNAAKHFIYDVYDVAFLDLYFLFVQETYRSLVLEGICYQLDKKNNGKQILLNIKNFEDEGQKLTQFLGDLKTKYAATQTSGGKIVNAGEVRIAICLGFHLDKIDTARVVPGKSLRALEIYEGIRFALEEMEGQAGPHFVIEVWDTENDSNEVNRILSDLSNFDPDILIGDISTYPTLVLGRWAEKNKVLQIIPRNPLDNLIDGKKFIFLYHPSLKTHAKNLAEYATKTMNHKRILIVNDFTLTSDVSAKAFEAILTANSATFEEKRVTPRFDPYTKSIPNYAKGFDAIYAPLESEENLGLLLHELNLNRMKIPVYTTMLAKDWGAIDPGAKTNASLTWSDYYSETNDSVLLYEFMENYIQIENMPPKDYTIIGYDMMRFLAAVLLSSNSKALPDVLRDFEKWHSIHQDSEYQGKQSNQRSTIVRFENGRMIKLN